VSAPSAAATALARALAAPEGADLRTAIPMPAQTALVVDPALGEDAVALAVVVGALARQGIPRGRLDVIVAALADRGSERALARRLAPVLGVPTVHARDPLHGDHFPAGVIGSVAIELDDVLREAEAVIVATAGGEAPWRAVVPGLASAWSARALAARPGPPPTRDEVLALVRVDWAVRFAFGAAPAGTEASGADAAGGRTVTAVRAGTPAVVWAERARS